MLVKAQDKLKCVRPCIKHGGCTGSPGERASLREAFRSLVLGRLVTAGASAPPTDQGFGLGASGARRSLCLTVSRLLFLTLFLVRLRWCAQVSSDISQGSPSPLLPRGGRLAREAHCRKESSVRLWSESTAETVTRGQPRLHLGYTCRSEPQACRDSRARERNDGDTHFRQEQKRRGRGQGAVRARPERRRHANAMA